MRACGRVGGGYGCPAERGEDTCAVSDAGVRGGSTDITTSFIKMGSEIYSYTWAVASPSARDLMEILTVNLNLGYNSTCKNA